MAEATLEDLRWLADVYEQAQDTRKALMNRARAKADGDDPHGGDFAAELGADFKGLEDRIFSQMKRTVRNLDIYSKFLSRVKGIGPTYTTKLLAWIDIEKADTVSALWKYAGLGVEMVCDECSSMEPRRPMRTANMSDDEYDEALAAYRKERRRWQGIEHGDACPDCGEPVHGEAQQRRRGMPTGYNPAVKSLCWNIGGNFLKNNSPYRDIYDGEKAEKEAQDWGANDKHRHLHSLRVMVKVFLSHLWVQWREFEDLPTRDPYVIDQTDHQDYYSPEEFVS